MLARGNLKKIFYAWIVIFIMSSSDAFATDGKKEIPQLPPPDPESEKNLPTIRLGETISFEQFGPIILNKDGSTRRINNWDILSDHEKEVTWRRISKRNEERRQALLKQQEESNNDGDQETKEL
ncbi:unnamed protein product [Cylindrotheca closterium]|uniref:Secreted protein n=1 Tax=Cylindrotheca closterium TaxID=2856 RepID=A0AAD2FMN3_9STRA|nr:unnamed protein product [Cylindrotheca closterium]